jgi:SAM-dependent methyltransferase
MTIDNANDWVQAQTNAVLQDRDAVDHACAVLHQEGLVLHPDRNKNWDNLLAIAHTLSRTDLNAAVLDAGAGDESAYLPSLYKRGYANLLGCNLDRQDDYSAGMKNGVRHVYADITATPFPSYCFDFIACLSVIEHGVDWRKFLLEMSRILVYQGELFVSFDYWPTKIETEGLITHDAPLNIFSAPEVDHLLDFANTVGLGIVDHPWNPAASQSVVSWAGKNYTFGNLLLRKFI